MIRARFVLAEEGNAELDITDMYAIPRPGDIVYLKEKTPSPFYAVQWVSFDPHSDNWGVIIGCSIPKVQPAPSPQNISIEKLRAADSDFQSRVFEHAKGYSNVILLAGYAGLFAIWGFVRSDLSKFEAGLVAILTGISLIIYVSYEIYSMVIKSVVMQKAIFVSEGGNDNYIERLERARLDIFKTTSTGIKVWKWCILIASLLAYGSAIYLGYAIVFRMLL